MKWYVDSGCLRLTRDPNLFATLSSCEGGMVTFGDDDKGKIIGILVNFVIKGRMFFLDLANHHHR